MALLFTLAVIGVPPLTQDIPPGTDVAVRVQLAKVGGDLTAAWDQLRPVMAIRPGAKSSVTRFERRVRRLVTDLERLTGADFSKPGAHATLLLDLDAPGGRVVSAVVRGALPRKINAKTEDLRLGSRRFTVGGKPAYRGSGMAWAFVERQDKGTVLVVGNERGLKRQLRAVRDGVVATAKKDPIVGLANRLRREAPVMAAFVLPSGNPGTWAELLDFSHFVERVSAGTLVGRAGGFEAHLVSRHKADQKAVAHGVNAAVFGVRGVVTLLQGSAELMAGLEAAKQPSELLPGSLKAKALLPVLKTWAKDFSLAAQVRARPAHTTEVNVTLSSYRGVLAAAMLGFAGNLEGWMGGESSEDLEAEVVTLLIGLRAAQLLQHEVNGRFVSCPPTPATVPTGPVPWPKESCFARLAFAPQKPLRIQLEATKNGEQVVLIARADPDGDGIPHVWYLGANGERVRGLSRRRQR